MKKSSQKKVDDLNPGDKIIIYHFTPTGTKVRTEGSFTEMFRDKFILGDGKPHWFLGVRDHKTQTPTAILTTFIDEIMIYERV